MKILPAIYIVLLWLITRVSSASTTTEEIPFTIHWKIFSSTITDPERPVRYLYFPEARYDLSDQLNPFFSINLPIKPGYTVRGVSLSDLQFQPLSRDELRIFQGFHLISDTIWAESQRVSSGKQERVITTFFPFRMNPSDGSVEKVVSGNILLEFAPSNGKDLKSSAFTFSSVLASGNWYKIRINKTGLYRITHSQLVQMGLHTAPIYSSQVRVFGNGGGMLPEKNSSSRYDDLQEVAIAVYDGGDGIIHPGDYVVFYGVGPDIWKYDPARFGFSHEKHLYDDYSYYFITIHPGAGKRVTEQPPSSLVPNYVSTVFSDYVFHEVDQVNLIKSGREWFGEVFDLITTYHFNFTFPNLKTDVYHQLRIRAVAKSTQTSSFLATVNGSDQLVITINGTPDNPEGQYARDGIGDLKFYSSSENITIQLKYNKSTGNSVGWLDYIGLNVTRNSVFTGGQMAFRDVWSVEPERITEFRLTNVHSGVTVWEVTDRHNITRVPVTFSGNTLSFVMPTSAVLREFIAFDGTSFFDPEMVGPVPNQNLHALSGIDYVIVSHPDFLGEARRLADFHTQHSGLSLLVVTPEEIYNEFSSGAADPTAIRDFMRMLYERDPSRQKPRYLLLFGDASYDPKNRVVNNTHFIPTFQSVNSLHFVNSFATDDYFGCFDPSEGGNINDMPDIGIGRFVTRTPQEAKMAVDKVIHYATSQTKFGSWRNVITFVADDENQNAHLNQAEQLANFIENNYKTYNVDKIYIDSYPQESTAGGQRYPQVNRAINSRIEKGTLIMNYTGHGGELGWAHERILEISDIQSWKNYNRLAVFITATCEFARYDDPGRRSAGEYVFLNPNGGGIALFTTSRLTFGSSNLSLNRGIYKYAFERNGQEHYAMGDLIRLAKMESSGGSNDKKFVLLGDPALKMAYPTYQVETSFINQRPVQENNAPDTLRALSTVTVSGKITSSEGHVITGFNGILHVTVFDKETEVTTLGQDPGSPPRTYFLRKNVIFNGRTPVHQGQFQFSFIVPKDIAYQYGFGKISYYAAASEVDAAGSYENIIIGGFDLNAPRDKTGPKIRLYINDTTFVNGGVTHENPVLIAKLFDESGINTVGTGIGHDITAILNDDFANPFILNDYYESDLKGYQYGTVRFPLKNLPGGKHEIRFKVWDVFNNSSEAYISFVVINQNRIALLNVKNYPNPFTTTTSFVFEHNQAGNDLMVTIDIFDITGRKVSTLSQHHHYLSSVSAPIEWDGTSDGGYPLGKGIYIYKIQITSEKGITASGNGKLVIVR